MQGFAAITANNGWAMAAVGATIVMCGLTVLSIVISQLHKLIELLEKKAKKEVSTQAAPTATAESTASEDDILVDLGAVARIYHSLTEDLGESFPLATLYQIFETEKVPHPHITIRELRDAGYLVPAGEGEFSWNKI